MNALPNIALEVFASAEVMAGNRAVSSREVLAALKLVMADDLAVQVSKKVSKLARFNKNGRTTPRDILTALREPV